MLCSAICCTIRGAIRSTVCDTVPGTIRGTIGRTIGRRNLTSDGSSLNYWTSANQWKAWVGLRAGGAYACLPDAGRGEEPLETGAVTLRRL